VSDRELWAVLGVHKDGMRRHLHVKVRPEIPSGYWAEMEGSLLMVWGETQEKAAIAYGRECANLHVTEARLLLGGPKPKVECTGVSAGWCPVHGDCVCPDRERAMDTATCPLHGVSSKHAEEEAPSELDQLRAENERLRELVAKLSGDLDGARVKLTEMERLMAGPVSRWSYDHPGVGPWNALVVEEGTKGNRR
jgi:hypothetical protein